MLSASGATNGSRSPAPHPTTVGWSTLILEIWKLTSKVLVENCGLGRHQNRLQNEPSEVDRPQIDLRKCSVAPRSTYMSREYLWSLHPCSTWYFRSLSSRPHPGLTAYAHHVLAATVLFRAKRIPGPQIRIDASIRLSGFKNCPFAARRNLQNVVTLQTVH